MGILSKLQVFTMIAGLCLPSALYAEELQEIRVGILPQPAESPEAYAATYQGMADAVGEEVGIKVKVFVSPSYNALIESLKARRLEMAFFGGEQYIAAKELGIDVVPLAKAIHFNRTYYKSQIIVKADSNIKGLADLKGRTFAFVSPSSTSGGMAPNYMLNQAGLNPQSDLGRIFFTGNHEASALAVKNGKVDAAGVADHYWYIWKDAGLISLEKYNEENDELVGSELRVIASAKVPEQVMTSRADLGEELNQKLRDALIGLPDEVFGTTGYVGDINGFAPTSEADYAVILEMKKAANSIPQPPK